MKNKITIFVVIAAMLFSGMSFATVGNLKTYDVPLKVMKFPNKVEQSMAAKSFVDTVRVVEKYDNYEYTVYVRPMKLGKITGSLTGVYKYADGVDSKRSELILFENTTSDTSYTASFSFSAPKDKKDVLLAVDVDAMSGYEAKLYLVFDWENAVEVEDVNRVVGNPDILDVAVNNKLIDFDVPPYINKDSRTMVPVRFISEALGLNVEWEGKTKTVYVGTGDKRMSLVIGTNEIVTADGTVIEIDTEAVIKEGRTMVPVRAIAELSGADVKWVGKTRTVYIDNK